MVSARVSSGYSCVQSTPLRVGRHAEAAGVPQSPQGFGDASLFRHAARGALSRAASRESIPGRLRSAPATPSWDAEVPAPSPGQTLAARRRPFTATPSGSQSSRRASSAGSTPGFWGGAFRKSQITRLATVGQPTPEDELSMPAYAACMTAIPSSIQGRTTTRSARFPASAAAGLLEPQSQVAQDMVKLDARLQGRLVDDMVIERVVLRRACDAVISGAAFREQASGDDSTSREAKEPSADFYSTLRQAIVPKARAKSAGAPGGPSPQPVRRMVSLNLLPEVVDSVPISVVREAMVTRGTEATEADAQQLVDVLACASISRRIRSRSGPCGTRRGEGAAAAGSEPAGCYGEARRPLAASSATAAPGGPAAPRLPVAQNSPASAPAPTPERQVLEGAVAGRPTVESWTYRTMGRPDTNVAAFLRSRREPEGRVMVPQAIFQDKEGESGAFLPSAISGKAAQFSDHINSFVTFAEAVWR